MNCSKVLSLKEKVWKDKSNHCDQPRAFVSAFSSVWFGRKKKRKDCVLAASLNFNPLERQRKMHFCTTWLDVIFSSLFWLQYYKSLIVLLGWRYEEAVFLLPVPPPPTPVGWPSTLTGKNTFRKKRTQDACSWKKRKRRQKSEEREADGSVLAATASPISNFWKASVCEAFVCPHCLKRNFPSLNHKSCN